MGPKKFLERPLKSVLKDTRESSRARSQPLWQFHGASSWLHPATPSAAEYLGDSWLLAYRASEVYAAPDFLILHWRLYSAHRS
jgi:hypothetical protein